MSYNMDVTDLVLRAKAEGRVEGMRAAAEIAGLFDTAYDLIGAEIKTVGEVARDISAAILAAAEKDHIVDAKEMVCEWKTIKRGGEYWLESECGTLINAKYMHHRRRKFCPYCGKPTKLNG